MDYDAIEERYKCLQELEDKDSKTKLTDKEKRKIEDGLMEKIYEIQETIMKLEDKEREKL